MTHGSLLCFCSEFARDRAMTGENLTVHALAFSRVLSECFRQTAILPFRFPTLVNDGAELGQLLDQHERKYAAAIARVRGCVQMEAVLRYETAAGQAASGSEYLRRRQEQQRELQQAAALVRDAGRSFTRDWRQRETSQGIRCFALIPRDQASNFQRRLHSLVIAKSIQARVTGPWPPTEFLEDLNG